MASGYVLCPCCGYETVASDDTVPELCFACEESGCSIDTGALDAPCDCREEHEALAEVLADGSRASDWCTACGGRAQNGECRSECFQAAYQARLAWVDDDAVSDD